MDPYRDPAASTRSCPRCQSVMSRRTVGDVMLDACLACRGVFLPGGLTERFLDPLDLGGVVLSERPDKPDVDVEHPAYLKCPHCAGVMNRRLFADRAKVIVDVCPPHGTWFDAGELRKVAAFVESGGQVTPSRAPDKATSKDEVSGSSIFELAAGLLDLFT